MNLSIVLPCYNEAPSISKIVNEFRMISRSYSWELLLVDNGSTDGTRRAIQQELASCSFLRLIGLDRNQGYGGGILAGLARAEGQVLAWSHADLQTPAEDIFRAYERLMTLDEPDRSLVKGRRSPRGLRAEALTMGMQVLASLVLRESLQDINAQPKVFPRGLLNDFQDPPGDFNLDLYTYHLALKKGWTVDTIPVEFGQRVHGSSKWASSLRSRARHILATVRYIGKLSREG